ncbi:MAG TPA: cell division ATP-binding protein FtsE [Thermodesulfobacteriota bacterium]|nr:cell division ATP-binding protein FtsE [Deltaproteobacteria bacterium]HNR12006.1 cell division ATP-binding protein FtsE [Thermodesulfobacteriota bacterium]HNU72148.1 cell division ATP-binding protein FtsE [Thermodesulfobacteriota bacterium]HOC37892.1 cell division ATP-binding protein FtsE [Thermodesulfobacteriota bacterium]HQO78419.1 cell division ATP-binding protein FtsE [Thermodesulfobacteriota bacterium]
MIQLYNVDKTYSSRYPALSDINLDIGKGEFVLIVGPSGAGKTTLLKLMFLSEMPSRGRVVINGMDTRKITGPQISLLRRKIGFVFQDFKLLPHRSVYDNVAISLEVLMMKRRLVKRRVQQVLKHVGLLNRADAIPLILSGGEQQRVAIARAVVKDPLILLADEPTGNLDLDITRDIMKLFKIINSWGTTIVIATHNKALLEYRPTKVIALKKGAIQEVFVSSRMANSEDTSLPSGGE